MRVPPLDWLNYHHLRYFWIVAQEGSVTRAGEILHVTPATVSIQVLKLERSLGVKLLKKSGRGIALTEAGENVHQYANEIFSLGRDLLDMLHGRPLGKPLLFRVGIKDVMPKHVAYQMIEPTLKGAEKVRLIGREGDATKLIADLVVHKLDVVLSDMPVDANLKARVYSHLLGESDVIVVGARELAAQYATGFPDSINQAPWLLPMHGSALRRSLDLWFEEHDYHPTIFGEFEDSAMLKIAGQAGVGVFAVPSVIRKQVQAMYGVELIGKIPSIKERFYAISAERKIKHPAVMAIRDSAASRMKRS